MSGVRLFVTKKCNLGCPHCMNFASSSNNEATMPVEMWKDAILDILILNKTMEDPMRFPEIQYTGGEPLMELGLCLELSRYIRSLSSKLEFRQSKGIEIQFDTNGLQFSDNIAKQLFEAGISRMQISIDGTDSHDDFRHHKGLFNRCLDSIAIARQNNLDVKVMTTVTNRSVTELDELHDILQAAGVHLWFVKPLLRIGRGYYDTEWGLDDIDNEKGLKSLVEICRTKQNGMYVMPRQGWIKRGVCLHKAGDREIAIKSDGDVQPCGFLPLVQGNLYKERLIDIIHRTYEKIPKELYCCNWWQWIEGENDERRIAGFRIGQGYQYFTT